MTQDEWIDQCAKTVNQLTDSLRELCLLVGNLEERIIALEQPSNKPCGSE